MAFDGEIREAPTVRDAPGVVYTESHGLKLFRCEAYRATMTAKSCAGRHEKAQDARGDMLASMERCRTCSIGAAHAGKGVVRYSRHYRAEICSRCGRGGRIISGRSCVSCWNRARELKIGANARGNAPVELMQRPLHAVRLRVEVEATGADGVAKVETRRIRDLETSGLVETVVQFLKTNTGEITFGWAGPGIQPRDGAAPASVADPLIGAVVALMAGRAEWKGNTGALLEALSEVSEDVVMSFTSSTLGRKLRHRAGALGKAGIVVEGGKLEDGRWGHTLRNVRAPRAAQAAPDPEPRADPLIDALLAMMADRVGWTGTWDELLAELAVVALETVDRAAGWPETGAGLAQKLRARSTALGEAGISVESVPAGSANGKRLVTVVNTRAIQDVHGAEDRADGGEPAPVPDAVADRPRQVSRYRARLFGTAALPFAVAALAASQRSSAASVAGTALRPC